MFSHIMIGTNDLDRAKSFYDAVLGTLDVPPARVDGHRIFYMTPAGIFSVSKPIDGEPATHANGGTVGFAAKSPEQADAWHAAGVAAGGTSIEVPPAATPAACQASALAGELAAKPMVPPLAAVAGWPSIGFETEKMPFGVM